MFQRSSTPHWASAIGMQAFHRRHRLAIPVHYFLPRFRCGSHSLLPEVTCPVSRALAHSARPSLSSRPRFSQDDFCCAAAASQLFSTEHSLAARRPRCASSSSLIRPFASCKVSCNSRFCSSRSASYRPKSCCTKSVDVHTAALADKVSPFAFTLFPVPCFEGEECSGACWCCGYAECSIAPLGCAP